MSRLSLAKIHPRNVPIRCISSPCTFDDKGRTKWRELLTRDSTVFHKRLTERWAGNKMKFGAKSYPRAPRRITLSSYCWPPPPPFPSPFSFSLEPPTQPSPISTYLFTATSNLWSSLDSSSGMEAKPKCVSKFEYVYTKEEKKKKIDPKERERERKEGKKPWARVAFICCRILGRFYSREYNHYG